MEIVRQKNVATRIVFPLVDADGDPVTGATSPDSEIDQWADGANPTGFADCTNEATEIGSTGMYYLNLTQTEMNEDYIVVQIKSGNAKTQVILIRTLVGDPLNLATTDDGTTINVASGIVEAQVKSIDNNVITANSINADALTAAKLASDVGTEIGTAVWATAARTLTALDEDSTTLDLDATIRGAVGLASANLDTQLTDLPTNSELATALAGADDATLAAIAALNNLSAAQVNAEVDTALADYDGPTNAELSTALAAADDTVLAAIAAMPAALLDLAAGVETGLTLRQALRLLVAAEAGKLSGAATTTITIRNFGDNKNRIVATVDADGNRSAITTDLT